MIPFKLTMLEKNDFLQVISNIFSGLRSRTSRMLDTFGGFGNLIDRQAQGVGALQGVASIGAVAGGIAAQPGSAVNNFIVNAIEELVGKFTWH